jgi:hypothetical protein
MADEDGAYTVSAEAHFELVMTPRAIEFQAVQPGGFEVASLRNPLLSVQIRNYNPAGAGPRSRAVAQIRWYSDTVPIEGTMNTWLERADDRAVIAAKGEEPVSFTALEGRPSRLLSWPSPYVYQPDARMCAWIDADLEAESASGDYVSGVLRQRVCEATPQAQAQDTILASRTATEGGVTRTVELRHMPGRGHRALVRVQAHGALELDERLCLHVQGFATCRRSATTREQFTAAGVAEFVTGYRDGLTGDICATQRAAPPVGACSSGEVELLKQHTYRDGINTNVVLVETDDGVFARYRFSIPEGAAIFGGQAVLRDLSDDNRLELQIPGAEGEVVVNLEQGPLPLGLAGYCYALDADFQGPTRSGTIEMGGCT